MIHDRYCEEYSEACGCQRRAELLGILAEFLDLVERAVAAADGDFYGVPDMERELARLRQHPLVIEALSRRLTL